MLKPVACPWPAVALLLIGYGLVFLSYAANRGRKYLRFVVPGWVEPYRLWLGGFALILIGGALVAIEIAVALHWINGTCYGRSDP
jgi:hypothetical protein